jgi:hypothetical protein
MSNRNQNFVVVETSLDEGVLGVHGPFSKEKSQECFERLVQEFIDDTPEDEDEDEDEIPEDELHIHEDRTTAVADSYSIQIVELKRSKESKETEEQQESDNHPPIMILEDGETFGSARGSLVICFNGPLPQDMDVDNADGRHYYEAIADGTVMGSIVPVSDLLKLRELVGDLRPGDEKIPEKMNEFMDAAGNLDLWN